MPSREQTPSIPNHDAFERKNPTEVERVAEETEGARFLTSEQIDSADSLNELITAAYGTEGLASGRDETVAVISYEEIKKAIKKIQKHLTTLKENTPAKLWISAVGFEDEIFSGIPVEKGFRQRAMELYDLERTDILNTLDMVEPSTSLKEKKGTQAIEWRSVEAEIKTAVKKHAVTITTYRKALAETHENLTQEKKKNGIMVQFKRFFGKEPQVSEEKKEELHALRYEIALDLKNASRDLRSSILEQGGTNDDIDEALTILRREMRIYTDVLVRGKNLLDTPTTLTYEREIFNGEIGEYSHEQLEELHRTYADERNRENELASMTGKFVPAGEAVESEQNKKEEESLDKALSIARVNDYLKKEMHRLDGLHEKIGAKIFERYQETVNWYKKLSTPRKIAITCSFAAMMFAATEIGEANASKDDILRGKKRSAPSKESASKPEAVTSIQKTSDTIPSTNNEPENIVASAETPIVEPSLTKMESVVIEDKLGKKGNSIWASLKRKGVSTHAISIYQKEYEKTNHKSIERLAKNGAKISYIYDKEADLLKEVSIEKPTKKRIAKSKVGNPTIEKTIPVTEEVVLPETQITTADVEKIAAVTQKKVKSVKSETKRTPLSDDEMPLPVRSASEESFLNIIDGGGQELKLYPEGQLPKIKERNKISKK